MSLPIRWMSAGQKRQSGDALVGEADGGDVVGQCVDPHIHHVLRVARNRHAPIECGAGDRQILQPGLDEAHHLVPPLARADELRIGVVMREEPVLIGGEAEEVALLLHPFDRRAERLTAHAVVAELGLAFVEIGFLRGPSTSPA